MPRSGHLSYCSSSKVADKDVVQEALDCFTQASEAESNWRTQCLDDLRFSTGEQWPLTVRTQREKNGQPCLTMDQITQSIRLTCNEFRQQRPAVQVNPVGDESDVDTAEIEQGLIRHIEVNSDAEVAYDNAHEQVIRSGIGHWRILSDYEDEDSSDQEIFLKPIRNQFSVYWQPGVPYEDAEWCLVITDVPLATYKRDYSESKMASLEDFTGLGNASPEWVSKDAIRVAEFFTVETKKGKNGRPKKQVHWQKLNAIEELDSRDLPGTSIPILTVVGDDIDVDGKRYVAGLVRNAKDPQRMCNYWNSKATESIALASNAPWIVAEGQLEGYENQWATANTKNPYALTYKVTDAGGKPVGPPQRNTAEPPIQAMAMMLQQSLANVKAAMGIYDPSLGQRRGDESGTAIKHLQDQGSMTTLNFSDNVARTMRRSGKLLLEWIRAIYDTPKVRRIIKPDGSVQQVVTHAGPDQEEAAKKLLTAQITKIFDIGTGRYDVTVSVGPSYQTKRQEAAQTQLELMKNLPQQAPFFADIAVGNMDIPQSREMAARLKKMLPPQLQDDDGTPESKLAMAQSQLQQLGQQHQMLVQHVNQLTDTIKTKQVETQGKVQIEQFKAQTDLAIKNLDIKAKILIAQIGTKSQEQQTRDQETTDVWNELHGEAASRAESESQRQHEAQQADIQRQHEQDLADKGALASQQEQQSDQGHDMAMAAVNSQNGDGESK